jgi:uncharacterized protein YecT (DUF1311 family)
MTNCVRRALRWTLFWSAATVLSGGGSVFAQQNLSTSTPPPPMLGEFCKEKKVLQDQNDCMEQAATQIKREFNRFFAKLAESIKDEKSKTGLRLAQDRWSEYRDKSCSATFDFYASGVMRSIMERTCEIQLTRSRMKDLEVLYPKPE